MIDIDTQISSALERHLSKQDGATPSNLAESMRYSLLGPGKRIRPRLSLATSKMIELPQAPALAAAISIEMVHCFTLIHDDLPCMDNDDFRRGRPSNHKKFNESIALLAGDALMALAMDVLLDAEEHVPPARLVAATRRLSWAMGARGVIGGQAAEALLGANSKIEELRLMHAKKTGALFQAAILIPADLAGISPISPGGQAMHHFSAELGLAFQTADDLEDAEKESSRPTSVLFYMSAENAALDAKKRLTQATEGLVRVFGPQASEELVAIANEVGKKLQ